MSLIYAACDRVILTQLTIAYVTNPSWYVLGNHHNSTLTLTCA